MMRRRIVAVLAAVFFLAACAGAVVSSEHSNRRGHADRKRGPHDATSTHPFDDVDKWVSVFDDPERDAWQKPAEVVAALDVAPGERVADLGAGTGYFLPYLSTAVGPEGVVWALDTEPKLVEYMTSRARREGWDNVRPVLCPTDSPGLPDGSVDLVLIVDTFHHLDDRLNYIPRLERALAPGGRVAIVDFRKDRPHPPGPPAAHRLDRDFVVSEFVDSGWRLDRDHDILPEQYVLVFRPAPKAR